MGRRRAAKNNDTIEDEPPIKVSRARGKIDLPLPAILKQSGKLLGCGQGDFGQLGMGEGVTEKTRPAVIPGGDNVVDICAGGMHSLYLTTNGDVWSFGCNDEGALGRETGDDGAEFLPGKIALPGPCIKISAGDSHSACLLEDGRAFAWGTFRDSHGNMGLTIEGNKRLPIEVLPDHKCVDISSGADHLVILISNGHIYTLGCAEQGQLGRVSHRSASGESRRGKTELLKPGLVYIRLGRLLADAIWATSYCTFFREYKTTKIFAFGLNNYHQLGLTTKLTEAVFSPSLTCFDDVKDITGGQHHTLVLTNSGKCYVIGRKDYGRLGLGDVEEDLDKLAVVKAIDDKKLNSVCCGDSNSFAVTVDGQIYAWGLGSNQQLGTGSEDDETVPVLLTGQQVKDKKVLKVASGGQHSLFIVADTDTEKSTKIVNGSKQKEVLPQKKVKETNNNKEAAIDGSNDEKTALPAVDETMAVNKPETEIKNTTATTGKRGRIKKE